MLQVSDILMSIQVQFLTSIHTHTHLSCMPRLLHSSKVHHSCLPVMSMCVQPKALDYSDELFESADTNKDNKLTLAELRDLMNQASKRYSHLEEHARFLDA